MTGSSQKKEQNGLFKRFLRHNLRGHGGADPPPSLGVRVLQQSACQAGRGGSETPAAV